MPEQVMMTEKLTAAGTKETITEQVTEKRKEDMIEKDTEENTLDPDALFEMGMDSMYTIVHEQHTSVQIESSVPETVAEGKSSVPQENVEQQATDEEAVSKPGNVTEERTDADAKSTVSEPGSVGEERTDADAKSTVSEPGSVVEEEKTVEEEKYSVSESGNIAEARSVAEEKSTV